MFTGLVQDVATIRGIERGEDSSILTIETNLAQSMSIGDSISINGVCLTATRIVGILITVDVMVQTLKLSNLGRLDVNTRVNAELATRVDARLGGHIVQGHVDGVAKIVANEPGEKWQRFTISIPGNLLKYVVNQGSICVDARLGGHIVQGHVDGIAKIVANEPGEKWQRFAISIPGNLLKYVVNQGSICVDGVSLTVGNVEDSLHEVTMWLIPETLAKTTLGSKSVGDDVNIEVDVLAKYVERLMSARGDKQ